MHSILRKKLELSHGPMNELDAEDGDAPAALVQPACGSELLHVPKP